MSEHARLMPRTDCRLRVRFGLSGDSPKQVAFSNNVSPQGMFLVTSRLEEPGCHIYLEVDLPDETVVLHGRVVWRRRVHVSLRSATKPGFGLQLLQAPESWYRFMMALGSAGPDGPDQVVAS